MDFEVDWILTDIEGTTTDVSFVYNTLFPYFLDNLDRFEHNTSLEVDAVLKQTADFIAAETGEVGLSRMELFNRLRIWAREDRKVTPLKELQGIVWKEGFESGALQGHVYPEVKEALVRWSQQGISIAIFSSGSVAAQKLLFQHSTSGDLSAFFKAHFDTNTGMKRDAATYARIADLLRTSPNRVLFLSDIKEELEAASVAGMHTVQLLRPGTAKGWDLTAQDFSPIIP
ncbi:MAG: acireductone synthase [Flavobacteriia bacterium]|nr:acireductone synthase [Flavobacteriia bacterium]